MSHDRDQLTDRSAVLPELSRRLRRVPAVRRAAVPAYQAYRRATAPRDGHRMLVNSLGKSGTHLISSQLTRLPGVSFSGIGAIHDQHAVRPGPSGEMPDYDARALERQLARCPRGAFVMSHLYWDQATESVLDRHEFSVVQVVRDPRDILVSRLHYIRDNASHPARAVILEQFDTWEEQILAMITGFPDSSYGRGWAPVNRRIELFLPWLDRVPTLHYEAFVDSDPAVRGREQTRLLEGLGLPVSAGSLEIMSGGIGDKWSATLRQGGAGGWRASFSDQALERFVEVAGPAMEQMGYSPG